MLGTPILSAVIVAALMAPAADEKPVLLADALVSQGLAVPGLGRVKLPAPTMPDGLTPAQQREVVEKFVEEYRLFTQRSVTASHALKIRSLNDDEEKRRGHRLDLHFIAYGTLKQAQQDDVIDKLLGLGGKGKGKKPKPLDDEALKSRKITRQAAKGLEEIYTPMEADLVEKVRLTGVLRGQRQEKAKSLAAAAVLDGRFADDKQYPNRWRPLEQKPGGEIEVGDPSPYSGFGGYVKVTELAEPKGALFIELHFVFHEPHEWFSGRNYLASKLPLAVRNNVQALRRALGK